MKLIIGLGNPGKEYTDTRHNIGFKAIDKLAKAHHINVNRSKFKAFYGEGTIGRQKVILIKPQTYMNLSGQSVESFLSWYKTPLENIIIIYDDVSLSPGVLRIRQQGGAGDHNGIRSIIQHLGTDKFQRIKIGVGEKPPSWDLADYVLSRFTNLEIKIMEEAMEDVVGATEMILEKSIQEAMNIYNSKTRR